MRVFCLSIECWASYTLRARPHPRNENLVDQLLERKNTKGARSHNFETCRAFYLRIFCVEISNRGNECSSGGRSKLSLVQQITFGTSNDPRHFQDIKVTLSRKWDSRLLTGSWLSHAGREGCSRTPENSSSNSIIEYCSKTKNLNAQLVSYNWNRNGESAEP